MRFKIVKDKYIHKYACVYTHEHRYMNTGKIKHKVMT
jgi:hypothetical protein